MTFDRLLTFAEAAELCAVSPSTLRRAQRCGDLTVIRFGKGAKSDRIHPADLSAFQAARRFQMAPISLPSVGPVLAGRSSVESAEEACRRILGMGRFKKGRQKSGQANGKS